jgi:hypothetical protein
MNTETGAPTKTRTSSSDNSGHAGRGLADARPLVAKIMPVVMSEAKRPDDDIFIWIPFCEWTSETNDGQRRSGDQRTERAQQDLRRQRRLDEEGDGADPVGTELIGRSAP